MESVWIVVCGLVVGLIARAVLPGTDRAGFVVTALLGIAGALLGSVVSWLLDIYNPRTFVGVAMSVLGAVAILALYRRTAPLAKAPRM